MWKNVTINSGLLLPLPPRYFSASSYPSCCLLLPEQLSVLTGDDWHKNIVHTCFSRRRLWHTWAVFPDVPGTTPQYTRMSFCSFKCALTCHHVTYDNICIAPREEKKRKTQVKLSFEAPFTLVPSSLQVLAEWRRLLMCEFLQGDNGYNNFHQH